jgi:hypothetical protein
MIVRASITQQLQAVRTLLGSHPFGTSVGLGKARTESLLICMQGSLYGNVWMGPLARFSRRLWRIMQQNVSANREALRKVTCMHFVSQDCHWFVTIRVRAACNTSAYNKHAIKESRSGLLCKRRRAICTALLSSVCCKEDSTFHAWCPSSGQRVERTQSSGR